MNARGGNATFQTLSGQYHDFDAPYKLLKSARAQNPSECSSLTDGNIRIWDRTGERFPNTAEGLRLYQSKCIRSSESSPVYSGYKESPKTGFKEWGKFLISSINK